MKKAFIYFLIVGLFFNTSIFPQTFISFTNSSGKAIPGESTQKGHENDIEAMSVSYELSNPASLSISTGGLTAGKVKFSTIDFMKSTGKASPALMGAACAGTRYDKATINFYKNNPVTHVPFIYLTMILNDVIVSNVKESGSGNEIPAESVSLSFTKITWNYFETDDKGVQIPVGSSSWNLLTNATK